MTLGLLRRFWPELLVALAVLALPLLGYWHGSRVQSLQDASERATEAAAHVQAMQVYAAHSDRVAALYEAEKSKRALRTRTVTKEIVREVEKPVYRECAVPADGVRLLNDARAGAPLGAGEPDGAVPAHPPATGEDLSR